MAKYFVTITNWSKIRNYFYIGDDIDLECVAKDVNGNVQNIAGEEITFTLSKEGTTYITKNNAKAGGSDDEIEITTASTGEFTIKLTTTNTGALSAGTYDFSIVFTTDAPSYVHYRLNETSGTTVEDVSGNERDGTATNTDDTNWVSGKLNNAIQLDGVNEYIDCGDIGDFEYTDAFSADCWIKTSSTGWEAICGRMDTDRGWMFILDSVGGKLRLYLRNTITTNEILVEGSSSGVLRDGNWHHIGFSYDGSGNASGVKLYIEAIRETESIIVDNLSATISVTNNLRIGHAEDTNYYFTGIIDEIAIYESEITAANVTTRDNSGTGIESIEPQKIYTGLKDFMIIH